VGVQLVEPPAYDGSHRQCLGHGQHLSRHLVDHLIALGVGQAVEEPALVGQAGADRQPHVVLGVPRSTTSPVVVAR
jgi:hypothetical protein